jgi:hypothetical protein
MSFVEFVNVWYLQVLVAGLAIAALGLLWLSARQRRPLGPLLVVLLGLLIAVTPTAVSYFCPIEIVERDKLVGNERHLYLTGWDQSDYGWLRDKSDAVVVVMANPNVTDDTIEQLKDFQRLKTLDLNDTKVTDRALEKIAKLSNLTELHLERTFVTDSGVKDHLINHPKLMVLWLRSTKVTKEAADAFKSAKEGRRVIMDTARTEEK